MDRQGSQILVKVNGAKTDYVEKHNSSNDFQWVLPKEAPIHVVPLREVTEEKPKMTRRKRLFMTIGAAILLGTGFGMAVLQVLGGQEMKTTTVAPTAPVEKTAEKPAAKSAAKPASTVLQPVTAYVIQAGAFSTKEKGQASLEEMRKKGVPGSLFTSSDKTYVMIGIASDEKASDAIRASYEKQGISTWPKEWKVEKTTVADAYKGQEAVIGKAEAVLLSLLQQTSLSFTNGKADEKEWARMEKEYAALPKDVKQEDVKKLLNYVSLSYNSFKEYKEKANIETFTKLQQFLLEGLAAYEFLISGRAN
ncbi:SPOR domain-containing protein [Microbacteriaceae bacterium 4G12]